MVVVTVNFVLHKENESKIYNIAHIETPHEYEKDQTINAEIYIDIKNQIESQFYQKLTEQYNIQQTYKRPLLYISKDRYNTTGIVQDGTGFASKQIAKKSMLK